MYEENDNVTVNIGTARRRRNLKAAYSLRHQKQKQMLQGRDRQINKFN